MTTTSKVPTLVDYIKISAVISQNEQDHGLKTRNIEIAESSKGLESITDNSTDITTQSVSHMAVQSGKRDLHFERQSIGTRDQVENFYTGQGLQNYKTITHVAGSDDIEMKSSMLTTAQLDVQLHGYTTATRLQKSEFNSQSDRLLDRYDQSQFASETKSNTDSSDPNVSWHKSEAHTSLSELSLAVTEQPMATEDNVTTTRDHLRLNEAEIAPKNSTDKATRVAISNSEKIENNTHAHLLTDDTTSIKPEIFTGKAENEADFYVQKSDLYDFNQATNIESFPTLLTTVVQTSAQTRLASTSTGASYSSAQMLDNGADVTMTATAPMTVNTDAMATPRPRTNSFIYKTYTVTSSSALSPTVSPVSKSTLSTTDIEEKHMDTDTQYPDTPPSTQPSLLSNVKHSKIISTHTPTTRDARLNKDNKGTGRRGGKNRNRDRENRKSNRRGDRRNKTNTPDNEQPVSLAPEVSLTSSRPMKSSIRYTSHSTTPTNSIPALDRPESSFRDVTAHHPFYDISTTPIPEVDTNIIGSKGLGTGAEIGIIIASISLFWLILGPLLFIVCRLKIRAKERNSGTQNDDMGAMLVEEMIRLELAKGRDKMYQTSVSDVMEIERLSVTCNGDYENIPNQNAGILSNQSSVMPETQYANVHGELYDSIHGKKNVTLNSDNTDDVKYVIVKTPKTLDIYSECDEGRDTITSISTPMMSRDHSQLTNFTGYRSNGSVSVDSGFDNRCSMKHENSNVSNISMDKNSDKSSERSDKPVYKGYTPVKFDTSSVDKSLDSSPAFSGGYANIRQLRREHDSDGSLTNDDTTSVDSATFDDRTKMANNVTYANAPHNSAPRKPKANHILDPTKYLICNNHIGSLEKTGNPRNSLVPHGGECSCAFREAADEENCECRAQSMERILDTGNYSNGIQGDYGPKNNAIYSPAQKKRSMNTRV